MIGAMVIMAVLGLIAIGVVGAILMWVIELLFKLLGLLINKYILKESNDGRLW